MNTEYGTFLMTVRQTFRIQWISNEKLTLRSSVLFSHRMYKLYNMNTVQTVYNYIVQYCTVQVLHTDYTVLQTIKKTTCWWWDNSV